MEESNTGSVLPLENLRAVQCMRRLSLSRSIIDTYKYQNRVLKTYYYNLNHIEETEMDAQDRLIVDGLAMLGRTVFHIFHSRGMVKYAQNKKYWMMRRAYVFINRVRNDPNINSISHDEIGQGVLDAFVICEPINTETSEVLAEGVFSSISLSKIKNLDGEKKVIWSFEEM
ncbi:hypothetical protein ABE61_18780 [Lysinibacillus sphaericus]|uniref:hypothetical protein n=1 Tax=Lysinibacillus sphaericus TaxID=1421 RepID=UPI0018CFC8AB|nr:hypothetical protein [Lysinibacillus sphaericus]MBG9456031.1 hypothetical protein [Lysinibacillus sphaericus]MBG9479318.1 hypothetical protein [Lysinibacillus sphaericus]MBG9593427.1 hypothetical protein [Lysinibacillus sphaericus]